MKKLLVLLLISLLILSLAACGESDTSDENSNAGNSQSQTEASTTTTSSQPTQPATLNPKTHFKFGKYVATYFDNDNQTYHETSLVFAEEYEGLEYHRDNFYTKEAAKKKYEGWGAEFDENEFSSDSSITLNNVTYYDLGIFEHCSEMYEMSDTAIKISSDVENWSTLLLNADGTLVLNSVAENGRYAPVGTVFTFVEE